MTTERHPYQVWDWGAQKKWDDFADKCGFYAFSGEQFNEGLKKFNATAEDVALIGCGCFVLKKDMDEFHKMTKEIDEDFQKGLKDPAFVFDMFRYELANHEYCITCDYAETLEACGLTWEQVKNNPMWMKELHKATCDYLDAVEEWEAVAK